MEPRHASKYQLATSCTTAYRSTLRAGVRNGKIRRMLDGAAQKPQATFKTNRWFVQALLKLSPRPSTCLLIVVAMTRCSQQQWRRRGSPEPGCVSLPVAMLRPRTQTVSRWLATSYLYTWQGSTNSTGGCKDKRAKLTQQLPRLRPDPLRGAWNGPRSARWLLSPRSLCNKQWISTHRGARTHDHKVKGLALCRLS